MRNLDLRDVYVDNNGNPLHGRITFYKFHTTEKASIYSDKFGSHLNNPCYTNVLGQTETQVFLDEIDYTLKLEKYNGNGNMNSDMNESSWVEVRTVDSLAPDIPGSGGEGVVAGLVVGTTEDLRSIDPDDVLEFEDGSKIVQVDGRYEPGDMPPVFYKFERNPDATEDGGSVIRHDSVYIWRLITPQILDVRVFGLFPSEDYLQMDGDYSNFRNAFEYANAKGIDVYIPQVYQSGGFYQLTGGIYMLNGKLHLDNRVMISGKSSTPDSTLIVKEIVYDGDGPIFTDLAGDSPIVLSTDTVRSSWLNPSMTTLLTGNPKKVIIDKPFGNDQRIEIRNAEIYVEKDINHGNYRFVSCNFDKTSRGKFNGCYLTFIDCKNVSDQLVSYAQGSTPCVVGPIGETTKLVCSDFTSANKYVEWMNIKGDANYGDLGEQTVNISVLDNAVVENCSGTITGEEDFSIEVHNFSGSLVGFQNGNLNLIDCFVAIPASTTSIAQVQLRRGSFTTVATAVTALLHVWDAEVNGAIVATGIVPVFEDCTINAIITGGAMIFRGCTINNAITTSDVEGQINFSFSGCHFTVTGVHAITATTPASVVVGLWSGNSADHHPITVDLTNVASNDQSHSYVYENNTRGFLPRYPKKTWIDNGWATPGAAWGFEQSLSDADPFKVILCSNGGPWDAIGDPIGMGVHGLQMDMPFFSIGTCTAVFKLSVSFEGSMEYGDRSFTQSYAFVGECVDTISAPASYKCTSFNDKLIGQPVPTPGWVNNVDWPTSCVATFERVK